MIFNKEKKYLRIPDVNSNKFRLAEIVIAITFSIFFYFFGEKSFSSAFVCFVTPIVILLPFQITEIKRDYSNELFHAMNELKSKNKKAYKLYQKEVEYIIQSIEECKEKSLYKYSYTPSMNLFEGVCDELISVFDNKKNPEFFYATARCDPESVNWFFDYDQISRIFLPKVYEKIVEGKIYPFQRLFIYKKEQLTNPLLIFLIILHNKSKEILGDRFQFKFIELDKFNNLIKNIQISDEMGVWGNNFVFIQKSSQEESGYSFDPSLKENYIKEFRKIWQQSHDYSQLQLDYSKIKLSCSLDKEVGKFIEHIHNNTSETINGLKVTELSLSDIEDIQIWVKGIQPLSVISNHA